MTFTRYRDRNIDRIIEEKPVTYSYLSTTVIHKDILADEGSNACVHARNCAPVPVQIGSFSGTPVFSYDDFVTDEYTTTHKWQNVLRVSQTDLGFDKISDSVSTIGNQWEIVVDYNARMLEAYKKAKQNRRNLLNAYHINKRKAYVAYMDAIKKADIQRDLAISLEIERLRAVRPKLRYWVSSTYIYWETKKRVLDTTTGRYKPFQTGRIPLQKVYADKFQFPDLILPPKPVRPKPIPRKYLIDTAVVHDCVHVKTRDNFAVLADGSMPEFLRYENQFLDSPGLYYHCSAYWVGSTPHFVSGVDTSGLVDAPWNRNSEMDNICLSLFDFRSRNGLPDPQSLLLQLWEFLESVALIKFIYLERRILRAKHPVKRLAEAFLLYMFAIRPLYSLYTNLMSHTEDVCNWCIDWETNISFPEKQRIRRRGSNSTTIIGPWSSYVANSTGYDVVTIYGKKKHLDLDFIAHANVAMQYMSASAFVGDLSHDIKTLMLPGHKPVSINMLDPEAVIRYADDVWNAIPFSFVVDMICNLSDSLVSAWNTPPYETPLTVLKTRRMETTWDFTPASGTKVVGSGSRVSYTRTRSVTPYEPKIVPYTKDLTATKAAIYAALAIVLA